MYDTVTAEGDCMNQWVITGATCLNHSHPEITNQTCYSVSDAYCLDSL